jgi:hypothetical protein
MTSARQNGRLIGILLLAQILLSAVINIGLTGPVFRPPGFLVNAAGSAVEMRVAVLLLMLTGAITIGVAIAAMPMVRQYSGVMATWLIALGIAGFATLAIEANTMLTMVSLSQQQAQAGATNEMLQALGKTVAATRNGAHYVNLLVAGSFILTFHAALFRFQLVPRAIAGAGMIGAALQLVAIARPLFGYPMLFAMLAPLALAQLTLVAWLIVRGFTHEEPLVPVRSALPEGAASLTA